ncbi:hypothetical protein GCM10010121_068050 [Streptomyces brasiliensis]|uniref:Uncharacterized protein n=1 Tax=Streptomyces brasiliensis TaxID=1954 RepID=A0A917L7D2_9ACTN|nr:hypothetical protein GCM10010121_068050 [Streptomyces brasiliensis]
MDGVRVEVTVRARCERLDLFRRLAAASLTELPDDGDGTGEWVTARLSWPVVRAARRLPVFSGLAEVVDPPEARGTHGGVFRHGVVPGRVMGGGPARVSPASAGGRC